MVSLFVSKNILTSVETAMARESKVWNLPSGKERRVEIYRLATAENPELQKITSLWSLIVSFVLSWHIKSHLNEKKMQALPSLFTKVQEFGTTYEDLRKNPAFRFFKSNELRLMINAAKVGTDVLSSRSWKKAKKIARKAALGGTNVSVEDIRNILKSKGMQAIYQAGRSFPDLSGHYFFRNPGSPEPMSWQEAVRHMPRREQELIVQDLRNRTAVKIHRELAIEARRKNPNFEAALKRAECTLSFQDQRDKNGVFSASIRDLDPSDLEGQITFSHNNGLIRNLRINWN